jgi:hypothetical protein
MDCIGYQKARNFKLLPSRSVNPESSIPTTTMNAQVSLPMPYCSESTRVSDGFGLESKPRTAWFGWHGGSKSVSISTLRSCVGLVVAAKSTDEKSTDKGKVISLTFDNVIAFHLGGFGSNTDRKWAEGAWGKVLSTVPNQIKKWVKTWNYPCDLYIAAVAGPHHPGTPKQFVTDYNDLVRPLRSWKGKTIKSELLLWTGGTNNPLTPLKKGLAVMKLANTGAGVAWHQKDKQ